MGEPVNPVNADLVFSILGQKEVERLLLIQRVAQLEALLKESEKKKKI